MFQGFDSFYGLPLSNMKDFDDDEELQIDSKFPNWRRVLSAAVLGHFASTWILWKSGFIGNFYGREILTHKQHSH